LDQDQNWGKDDSSLEGIEARFQQDPLTGFGHFTTFIIDSLANQQLLIKKDAWWPHVGPCPKFLAKGWFCFGGF